MNRLGAIALSTLLLGTLPVSAQADAAPGWITAKNKRCKIWNPSPQPNESVTWSGPCKDGYASGKGILRWTENGKPDNTFEGEYAHGKRNGHGTMIAPDGKRTEGDWTNDEPVDPGESDDAI